MTDGWTSPFSACSSPSKAATLKVKVILALPLTLARRVSNLEIVASKIGQTLRRCDLATTKTERSGARSQIHPYRDTSPKNRSGHNSETKERNRGINS